MPETEIEKQDIDARQANSRHMNLRVLIWSLGSAIVLFIIVYTVFQVVA